jgi:hypothetical protein
MFVWVRRRQSSLSANRPRRGRTATSGGGDRRRRRRRVYMSTDNVDGGTGPRAERRLRGRGALRQSAGWGLLRIEYRARSLLTWQRERSSSLRLSGGGDDDGGGGGSVGLSFGEIQTKTRAPRDYVNAGAAELYRSRMLILARLSVRFSGLIVCVWESWCSSQVGGWTCARTAFSSGGRACCFCETRRAAGRQILDTPPASHVLWCDAQLFLAMCKAEGVISFWFTSLRVYHMLLGIRFNIGLKLLKKMETILHIKI